MSQKPEVSTPQMFPDGEPIGEWVVICPSCQRCGRNPVVLFCPVCGGRRMPTSEYLKMREPSTAALARPFSQGDRIRVVATDQTGTVTDTRDTHNGNFVTVHLDNAPRFRNRVYLAYELRIAEALL